MKTKIKNTYSSIIKKFFNSPSNKLTSTFILLFMAAILLSFYLSPKTMITFSADALLQIIAAFIFLSIIAGVFVASFVAGMAITYFAIITFNFIGDCIAEKVVDEIEKRKKSKNGI